MTVEKEEEGVETRRNVIVGVGLDSHSKELLSWALVKVAEAEDHVIAVHVCRNSGEAAKENKLLDDYLGIFKELCHIKKVELTGQVLTGKSIRKTLVNEAKNCSAVAVIVGISKQSVIGGRVSTAKYCAKHLPPTTEVLTVHDGKVVFKRTSNSHSPILRRDPKPSLYKPEKPLLDDHELTRFETSEIDECSPKLAQTSKEGSRDDSEELHKERHRLIDIMKRDNPRFGTSDPHEVTEEKPGWPLLRQTSLSMQNALDARKMSVVQWVMSLPNRPQTDQTVQSGSDSCSSKSGSPPGREIFESVFSRKSSLSAWREFAEDLAVHFELNSSDFTWFSYEVLKHATSEFCSENLIGKGGCSRVYKGVFFDGRSMAVKVLKSSKEAWKDFSLEVKILSSVQHKNITPLLGVCIENNELICVYDFMSKGSLEENLHGENKGKCVLQWEARFKIALGVAEALNYLHNGCSRPVIHRDVKSSNILLSDEFEPQLSDFGLAVWRPSSAEETYSDIVGTFGYLAPEYFMYGKVSDKIDVYSFGVVLLELLSGRKPIDSSKGQESLVIWAKPVLESGKLKGILDPNLGCNFDECQLRRMALAATLCLTRAARLRPNMTQILKLLKGEETIETWTKSLMYEQHHKENLNIDDDEIYQYISTKSHLSLALLDVEDEFTSYSSVELSSSPYLEDYLRGRCSRSSSFD